MGEFEVKVLGVKPPGKPDGTLKRLIKRSGELLKAMLMRPRVLVIAGLAGAVIFIGTPPFARSDRLGAVSRSALKISTSTTAASPSSGSPALERAAYRSSRSKKPR
ncbi:hypothetical protein LNKW23_40370 [Paralimibaculum aggregatum]|uniref:Uncharacterized protein n=1 Tax=Paralimibaculum aggregatum TaxID=3036245 RepID=A0ABQ6LQ53_9RHOB|nr:hypothetical protein LNKW23_40370 [Limibaculum sp. NKW23]